ncbi:type VI secretion system contractile sheath large subunit [Sodalis ligni]|nr:type VI secretion system contractile sheath large subunit [Sodalis ligni]
MDGKHGAEDLIASILPDSALLQLIAGAPAVPEDVAAAAHDGHDELRVCHVRLYEAFRPKTDQAQSAVAQAVKTLAQQVLENQLPVTNNAFSAIQGLISAIDEKLSRQINVILHHPDFQKLEGAWRGLHYLVSNTESSDMLKIRVLNISKQELSQALKRYKGASWDQSPLFKRIYEEEYGQFGGEPLGCLVGDYYFDHSPPDTELLGEMAKIAAAAHCPFISGASPGVMQMESWQELSNPRDLSKIFLNTEYAAWRMLRESEDARYLGLVLPRVLARLPYGIRTHPVDAFLFEEQTDGPTHGNYVWSNAAYAMAVNINRSFREYGWCTSIRGVESGGAVDNLLCHTFPTDDGGLDIKCPTEIAITDRREAELAKNGFMPLVYRKNSDFAAFIGAQSLQKPAEYDDADATANANLAARLPYLFACCRFAHYLKCIVRDKVGSFQTRDEMERWLNKWIINYVDGDPANSSQKTKARRPLAAAEVEVCELEDNPGYYQAKFFLRPHYQLEGLTVSLRLVSKLPSLKQAGKGN